MSRFVTIAKVVSEILPLSGDMAEVGVWRGTSAATIHKTAPSKVLHLYDTFKGVVKADKSIDVHSNGDFSDTSVEIVKNDVGEEGEFLKYHVGIFPDTFTEHDRKFCFVYSDTDTYFGTKATLSTFAPIMVSGGKIMFDDYEWRGCPGVKKAITEFLQDKSHLKTDQIDSQFIITF